MTIGKFCREFRTKVLQRRLVDLAPDTIGTLSAFEHGSSSNMKHLATYLRFQEKRATYLRFQEKRATYLRFQEKRAKMKKQTTVKFKVTNNRMDIP